MDVFHELQDAQKKAEQARAALHRLGVVQTRGQNEQALTINENVRVDEDIYSALSAIDDNLARSYAQVCADIQDANRLSWAGTAHEIREMISHTLRILAPDENVTKQLWYKPELKTSGPTQKQRAVYVLRQRRVGSKEQDVIAHIDVLEEKIANLVRDTYSRASDAAHRHKQLREVKRIFIYFNAFIRDLLDV